MSDPPAGPSTDVPAASSAPKHRWPWVVLLVAFGALGIYLGAPDSSVLRAAWARLGEVPGPAISIVLGGAVGLVITEALRIHVIGRLVGARVAARDAWDAAVANHVMTAITPQVGLGEPTVAYVLGKRGIAWDAAVAIPFIKFTTSLALVMLLGALLVMAGFGPPVATWISAAAAALFVTIAALTTVVIAVCSRPPAARRWIGRISGWLARRRWFASASWQTRITSGADVAARTVDRLVALRTLTISGAAVLVAVHLVYYASYVAPLVGLAFVLADPPLIELSLRALVFLCFIFATPTPGGTGASEAAAGAFFVDFLAPADAIIVVAVFRAATFYLQLAIGALYLPIRSLALSRI